MSSTAAFRVTLPVVLITANVAFLSPTDIFFKINVFKEFFQEYTISVKQFGPRLGPTICPA